MGTRLGYSGRQAAVSGGVKITVLMVWLVWSNHGLRAQAPYYSTGSGKTTTFAYYDPLLGPPVKAPITPFLAPTPTPVTVASPSQFAAIKSAIGAYSQSSFSSPPAVQISTVIPHAPGTVPAPIAQTPTASFQGILEAAPQFEPASPDVAVGPSDVVMVVNSTIAVFTKSGTERSATAFQDFFSAIIPTICPNGTSNCLIFDPTVRYDQLHGHFLFLAASRNSSTFQYLPSYLLLSVSNGATYDSGWKTWVLDASLDGSARSFNYADFWRVGFDDTAVYLAGNMYNASLGFEYAKIRVLLKSNVYNLTATSLPYQDLFNLQNADGSLADGITPVHQRGSPTAVNSQLLVNATAIPSELPASFLTVWKIADPTATPLAVTRSAVTGLKPYSYPASAPQLKGTGNAQLITNDSTVLKAVYRNGFLYTARNTGYTDTGLATTVTYDVIDTSSMKLVSQAWLTNQNVFYPSFDVPATTPSGTQFATPNLITGTTTASNGSLTYAGISNLKVGEDVFDYNSGEAPDRWGDYFGGAVDPVTGGLWASGQYAKTSFTTLPPGTNGQWGTWAGYFPWLTTSVFGDVPSTNVYANYINVLSLWQITTGCTPTSFCPTDMVLRNQMAVFVVRSMLGNPCPSNTPCSTGFTYTATPYFTDVASTDVYFPYIQKLKDLGITAGCTATTFCSNQTITRAEAAVFLVRGKLKSLFGDNFTYPCQTASSGCTPFFTDVPMGAFAYSFIQKLFELGITTGCSATQFCPDMTLTRQEAAVFVVRAFLN